MTETMIADAADISPHTIAVSIGMPSYAIDVVVNVPSFPVESTANVLFKFIIYFLCTVTFLLIRWSAYLLPASNWQPGQAG